MFSTDTLIFPLDIILFLSKLSKIIPIIFSAKLTFYKIFILDLKKYLLSVQFKDNRFREIFT